MLTEVTHDGALLALILRASFRKDGVNFLTPDDYSQQLAYIQHPAGKVIPAHVHNRVTREVTYTQEVLFIRSGRIRVDFYSPARDYLRSYELGPGDVILLASGGHGFEVIEPCEMIEVKQGPYAGEMDKTRFAAGPGERIVWGA